MQRYMILYQSCQERQWKSEKWGISSAGRALHWQCRGQRFDPAMLHHNRFYDIIMKSPFQERGFFMYFSIKHFYLLIEQTLQKIPIFLGFLIPNTAKKGKRL